MIYDPLGPGPNVMRLAQQVDTKEAREAVYCALVDHDVLWLREGLTDPVNAMRLALGLDQEEQDFVFVATALKMLADLIKPWIVIDNEDDGCPAMEQPFVRALIDGDDS